MRGLLLVVLLLEVVMGVRRARKRSSSSAAIRAVAPPDSLGRWTALASPQLFGATTLSLSLPGSQETSFHTQTSLVNSVVDGDGVQALKGTGGGAEMTAVLLKEGTIAGSIVDPMAGMVHHFIGEEGGELNFTSVRSDTFPEELDPEELLLHGEPEEFDSAPGVQSDDGSVMDVMVLWTKEAECANARLSTGCSLTSTTHSQMMAKVNLAVQETNDAYKVSRIFSEIRLVHAYRHASYVEETFSKDLSNLATAGGIDGVHEMREKYGADIVALINADPQYCGLAYMGPSKSSMFSVTSQGCATGYYSFGHEIGHNLGCNHDRGATNACSNSRDNYGFRDPEGVWRDTLSYACKADDCMGQPVKGSCTRMKFYSNPDVNYAGKPSGWAGKANLAKQINSVKGTVAAYYQSKPGPGPSPTPPPSPPQAAMQWRLGGGGKSCTDTCRALGKTCQESQFLAVNSAAIVEAAARQAGRSCNGTESWAYDHMPGICTSGSCCNGGCVGICAFGNTGKRTCSGLASSTYQRLCPCN